MRLTVIGGGIIGLWTAAEAVRRGFDVELFEQFKIGHDRGSSHGDTRIFRSAYWEGAEYVLLAERSIPMWDWLNTVASAPVFDMIGGYYAGAATSPLISGVAASAAAYSMPVRDVPPTRLAPHNSSDTRALEETLAGVIFADVALAALKKFCTESGVKLLEHTAFSGQQPDGSILVRCAGPWFSEDPRLSPVLTSNRVYCHWFAHDGASPLFQKVFLLQGKDGRVLYGMPADKQIVKVGWHNYPVIPLAPGIAEDGSPPRLVDDIRAALARLTGTALVHVKSKGCYFTNSLDENYIVDRVAEREWVVAGLSGHGFKFAPALAAAALDGVQKGKLPDNFGVFALSRFDSACPAPRTHVPECDLMIGDAWQL